MNQQKRLFFALWPGDVRTAIVAGTRDVCSTCGGRVVDPFNLHLTLAFLHSVDTALLPCVRDAAQRASSTTFSLTLENIGWWQRAKILWLSPSETPVALQELVNNLWRELGGCGFTPERRAFMPHVTLARRVTHAPREPSIPPIRWQVDSFSLVESVTGQRQATYRVLETWPLS